MLFEVATTEIPTGKKLAQVLGLLLGELQMGPLFKLQLLIA